MILKNSVVCQVQDDIPTKYVHNDEKYLDSDYMQCNSTISVTAENYLLASLL